MLGHGDVGAYVLQMAKRSTVEIGAMITDAILSKQRAESNRKDGDYAFVFRGWQRRRLAS